MKGQPTGSQSWSRQQAGYNDLQLYQQQLMYKQLQDFQRQQQLHHLEQETWQQTSPNHLSSISKHPTLDQLPTVVNGMPISDAPKYAWENENMPVNMNWTQSVGGTSVHRLSNGVSYSQDQGQILQSTGHSSQQVDQYLYGTPVSANKTPLNQFSNFNLVSNDGVDTLARSVGSQFEKPTQFNAFNSFQNEQGRFQGQMILQDDSAVNQRLPGKPMFYPLTSQNVRGGNISENFDQLSNFRESQEQADWSGSAPEKASQFDAQEMVKLDATEQRLLFSGNDDTPWDVSLGARNTDPGGMYRNLLDGNSGFSAFPSLQSGSWSALMQSAVAEASSSDTGLQNEWNGSSLQQKELSTVNSPAFVNYGKHPTSLVENLQNEPSLTPRTFPLFDDADVSSQEQASSFLHQSSLKSAYNRDGELNAGTSHQRIQLSSKDASNQMDKSELHSQFQISNEPPLHFGDASGGAWTGLLCEQPESTVPVEARQNPLNMQDSWAHQPNTQSYNMGSQSHNRMNGWRINESLGHAVLKVQDHESPSSQQSNMRSPRGSMHAQKEQEKSAPISRLSGGFNLGNSEVGVPQVQMCDFHTGNFAAINTHDSKSTLDGNPRSLAINQSDYSGKTKRNEENNCQVWESPVNFSSRASTEVHDRRKEKDIQKELPDEGYVSTNSNTTEGINKPSVLFGIQSRPSSSGSGRDQANVGPSSSGPGGFQFQPMGNFGDNAESDAQKRNFYAQGQSHELKNPDQGYIRASQFSGRSASGNTRDVEKNSFDSLGNVKGVEKWHTGGSSFGRGSNVPNSFDDSATFFAKSRSPHASQNMLELLHKLDQSRDTNSIPSHVFSNCNTISEGPDTSPATPNFQQASTLRGTGLHLSLPSQQHQPVQSRAFLDHNRRQHFDPMHEAQRETLDDTCRSSEQTTNENSHTASITSSRPPFFLQQQQQSVNVPLRHQIDPDEHSKDTSDVSGQVLLPGAASRMPSDARSALLAPQHQSTRSSVPGFGVQSAPQPLARPGGPQQGAFSAMLQNVWTHVSAQRQLNSNFSQALSSNPLDEQGSHRNQIAVTGEQHTSKENPMRPILSGRSDIPQGGETSSKQSPAGNSSLATPPFVHNKPKPDQTTSHSSLLNIAASGSSGHHLKPSDAQHSNYSLLQQMQAMKALESDPSKWLGKRPKASEAAPDAQSLTGKSPQTIIYGYNSVPRVSPYKELNLAASQSPFTSDSKMLCFSSEASAGDSVVRKEVQSQGLTNVSLNDSQNQSRRINVTSTSSPSIDPQMAPSWFGQYDKLKNEQILSIYNSLSDQKAAQRLAFPNVPSSMEAPSSSGKVNDSDQVESIWRSSSAAAVDRLSPVDSPADASDQDLTQKPKRHKTSLSARLSWHKEITGISARLPSISMAESSWAYAANRLIDKVDDECDMAEDVVQGFRARRRLILTTQLTQLFFPAVPAKILRSDSKLYYDSVTYLAARLALGRACGGIALSRRDPSLLSSKTDLPETTNGDKDGDMSFSKAAEDLVARARKLEDDISRFESTLSIPDLRVECQDLERFSMINRFARFHSRGQPMGVETLPTSEAAHRRIYPQRYVAAMPMQMVPSNLADGFPCFSL